MLERIQRWLSLDTMLPAAERLGPVGTTKQLYGNYLKIAWPATLQGLMLQFMTAIDLAMVGALGASALASVGIMGQPEMVMLIFCRALSIAVTAIIARRHGESEVDGMNAVLKQSILLNFLIYAPLLAICFFNLEHILRFTGAEDGYIETAVWYGRFIVISLIFQSFSQIVGAALIGYGNTKFHVGGSSLGEQFFERFGMYTYTMIVASLGAVPLAAHYVCMNLMDIFYYFAMGLGFAGASHTGQSLGHKRPDIAKTYGKIGARIGFVVGLVSALIFIGPGDLLVQLYTRESEVITLAGALMGIMAIAAFPQALQQVYSGVLKGAGDTYYIMKYSLVSVAIIRPIITYLLCITFGLGLLGAWLSLCFDQSLRLCCSYIRFIRGAWQHKIV